MVIILHPSLYLCIKADNDIRGEILRYRNQAMRRKKITEKCYVYITISLISAEKEQPQIDYA